MDEKSVDEFVQISLDLAQGQKSSAFVKIGSVLRALDTESLDVCSFMTTFSKMNPTDRFGKSCCR
jgi:hypothetical protein